MHKYARRESAAAEWRRWQRTVSHCVELVVLDVPCCSVSVNGGIGMLCCDVT